jgi:hypothetical protein
MSADWTIIVGFASEGATMMLSPHDKQRAPADAPKSVYIGFGTNTPLGCKLKFLRLPEAARTFVAQILTGRYGAPMTSRFVEPEGKEIARG